MTQPRTSLIGTHIDHCCPLHGCKYGDTSCPVAAGRVEPDHPCEQCCYDREHDRLRWLLHHWRHFDEEMGATVGDYFTESARSIRVRDMDIIRTIDQWMTAGWE